MRSRSPPMPGTEKERLLLRKTAVSKKHQRRAWAVAMAAKDGQMNALSSTGSQRFDDDDLNGSSLEDNVSSTLDHGDEQTTNESALGNDDKNSRDLPPEYRVCRVVALPDGKLPTSKSELPSAIVESPNHLLDRLDAIYHAISHEETRRLRYLERSDNVEPLYEAQEEKKLVSVLRNSLEDAGFELLTRRDIDLCEALNAGYLLRLSIAPDVSSFDPGVAKQFYPEYFDEEGNADEELLFDGRVLLFRRGYSAEVTQGRLLGAKIDYLQASLVQRSARRVAQVVARIEKHLLLSISTVSRHFKVMTMNQLAKFADSVPFPKVAYFLRTKWGWKQVDPETLQHDKEDMAKIGFFKFSRYGGGQRSSSRFMGSPSWDDALDPFIACDVEDAVVVNREDVSKVNGQNNQTDITSGDRSSQKRSQISSFPEDQAALLERVSINNVVDLSTKEGRRTVVKRFFSKSKLVEPTYKEVIAIWRPLPKKPKPKLRPPKVVYSVAEVFEVDDRLPAYEEPEPDPLPPPLEIRTYDDVPMANLPAVLPKTKLLFRPADAFVFDLVTILSLAAVLGSQRFDSPRLDILAVVSGTLWIIRTIIRYSNKLARYDLLVKSFLTSKISHRNSGALKYIAREAGNQRASRAALVYLWLSERIKSTTRGTLSRKQLMDEGLVGVNELLEWNGVSNNAARFVRVDMDATLNDLADLNMIEFNARDDTLVFVRDDDTLIETLLSTWTRIFQEELSLNRLVGRRRRQREMVTETDE